jgi:hypothetical protein
VLGWDEEDRVVWVARGGNANNEFAAPYTCSAEATFVAACSVDFGTAPNVEALIDSCHSRSVVVR